MTPVHRHLPHLSQRLSQRVTRATLIGLVVSLTLHALVLTLVAGPGKRHPSRPPETPPAREIRAVLTTLLPTAPQPPAPPRPQTAHAPARSAAPEAGSKVGSKVGLTPAPVTELPRWLPQDGVVPRAAGPAASMAAPPPPTAEQWAFASGYTPRNGKAYRHSWAQQVRSQMGTAFEGPDQGAVRFRVEIAPDGTLARLDTVWSTSAVAERLARGAMAAMPRWPAPPGGRSLIFERTLEFSPHAHDDPPRYEHDCEPEAPRYVNRFAWDGHSPQLTAPLQPPEPPEPVDPVALADCLRQLPRDAVEAAVARDRRAMERWGWSSSRPER